MTAWTGHVVVIAIGNVVRSDDGLGIRALERLCERNDYPPEVELIDGGISGLLLLPYFSSGHRLIIIDAINVGAQPGTLIRLADAVGVFATGITPHDVGLADLLDAARLTDVWPETLVLHGIQPASTALGTELSPVIDRTMESFVDTIEAELDAWGYPSGTAGSAMGADPRLRA